MKCQSGFSVCGVSSVNLGCGVSVWDGIYRGGGKIF